MSSGGIHGGTFASGVSQADATGDGKTREQAILNERLPAKREERFSFALRPGYFGP